MLFETRILLIKESDKQRLVRENRNQTFPRLEWGKNQLITLSTQIFV
jgi:hypothetical protein